MPPLETKEPYSELKWNSGEPPLYCPTPSNGGGEGGEDASSNASPPRPEEQEDASLQGKSHYVSSASASDGASSNNSSSCSSNTNGPPVPPSPIPPRRSRPLPMAAERTALLVVDVQPEYWSECPAVRQDFPDFPKHLEQTVATCRQKKVHTIIWVRADYRYEHSPWLVQFARIHQLDWATEQQQQQPPAKKTCMRAEVVCDPASNDFTWEPFATPQGGEVVLPKSSWSSTTNTGLMPLLAQWGIDTVLVCGLITSVCVQHSAFGVFEAGYRTLLVTDACADRGRARHEAALALYGNYMYELVTSDELANDPDLLQPAQPIWVVRPTATTTTAAVVGTTTSSSSSSSPKQVVTPATSVTSLPILAEEARSSKKRSSSSSSPSTVVAVPPALKAS